MRKIDILCAKYVYSLSFILRYSGRPAGGLLAFRSASLLFLLSLLFPSRR